MKLGFVSAILAELSLEEVFGVAAEAGYSCVEVMCWPPGKAERRYAGVSHLDAVDLDAKAVGAIRDLIQRTGVGISGLGYYPNPLAADRDEARVAVEHLGRVIDAAATLGVGVVNSFVGRDPALSVEANWPRFLETWRPIVAHAEAKGIRIGIENCPMLFTADEWPGGKNLATSPAIWRQMFADIPSPHFGLNFDPSHFVWQQMDYLAPLHEFKDRLFHVHAKDARADRDRLDSHGVLSYPKLWHTPKLPGLGDVRWGAFFGALTDAGYDGPVAVEVEDRAFEGSPAKRKESLIISRRYLSQYIYD
ncbi:MAG TPA: sugar phosphate isomerase/epimerase [Isosphaeraceae bacterium]|jgi:sugar phosphate isomerase/epimerase|nr:sugar phosphate isomerase/epimerase [Isosphaeraceae bacterium]